MSSNVYLRFNKGRKDIIILGDIPDSVKNAIDFENRPLNIYYQYSNLLLGFKPFGKGKPRLCYVEMVKGYKPLFAKIEMVAKGREIGGWYNAIEIDGIEDKEDKIDTLQDFVDKAEMRFFNNQVKYWALELKTSTLEECLNVRYALQSLIDLIYANFTQNFIRLHFKKVFITLAIFYRFYDGNTCNKFIRNNVFFRRKTATSLYNIFQKRMQQMSDKRAKRRNPRFMKLIDEIIDYFDMVKVSKSYRICDLIYEKIPERAINVLIMIEP